LFTKVGSYFILYYFIIYWEDNFHHGPICPIYFSCTGPDFLSTTTTTYIKMTGKFSEKDPARCAHYAGFLSRLSLTEANLLFWLLFLTVSVSPVLSIYTLIRPLLIFPQVLILLCIASVQHHKSIALGVEEKELPKTGRAAKKRRSKIRRLRLHYLSIVSLCAVLSFVCTVFEVFALFSVEFCGGEDLMMLYWGFWSVLQVGSNIAILGVMLQFWIVLGDVETPSWAVALGTPVLVFAALGFVLKALWVKAWDHRRGRNGDLESQTEDDETVVDDRVGEKRDDERHGSEA
jgi:hypothetical protein